MLWRMTSAFTGLLQRMETLTRLFFPFAFLTVNPLLNPTAAFLTEVFLTITGTFSAASLNRGVFSTMNVRESKRTSLPKVPVS